MFLFGWVKSVVPIDQLVKLGTDLGEEAFAEAGAAVYVAASKTIAAANAHRVPQPLDENRKKWLRSNFDTLVDQVRVVYSADLIPAINVLGVKLETSTIAQTFGDRVYMRHSYSPNRDAVNDELTNQLIHAAHELVHVRQYHNRGKSLYKFGKAYFRGFLKAGFSVNKNSMEVEAFDFHRCFQKRLFSKIAVPELWRTTVLKELTSLMPFTLNGQPHYLAYKKSSGYAEIGRIHADAQGIDPIWSTKTGGNWTKGWTAFVPFTLGGKPHYLAYKAGSGQVAIDRIRPDGKGVDTIWPAQGTETWSKGWTSFVPFSLSGKPHYVAYKVSDGQVNIDRIRPDGQGVETIWPGQPDVKWKPGWTSFVPFVLNGKPHHLAYQSATGKVHIDRIRPGGQGVDTLVETTWRKGWTSMIGFVLDGRPHILSYGKSSGYANVSGVNNDGMGTQSLWCDQWTKGWTAFFPFDLNGKRHHLTYKTGDGMLAIDLVEISP